MRVIKFLAFIFTLFGMLSSSGTLIAAGVQYYGNADTMVVGIICFVMTILPLLFGLLTLVNILRNKKSIFLGILTMLFAYFLGGLFYLIWTPSKK